MDDIENTYLKRGRTYLELYLKSPLPPSQKKRWVEIGLPSISEGIGLAEVFELHPNENLLKECKDLMENEKLRPIIDEIRAEERRRQEEERDRIGFRGLSRK
ncbi:hypothetical protein HYW54_04540 [Candidatus Gottesmanbacteria bacterium]|nr:hypothetical protein [Candidatus Gottesmanbacteria bacterium]